jgi:flagellar motor switch protein FliM
MGRAARGGCAVSSGVLGQADVDALMSAVQAGRAATEGLPVGRAPEAPTVQVYDFKRPERVSKDQMRALEVINEGFARDFGAALSGLLRTIIEVRVATTEQMTYNEFIQSLPNPTCFNLLDAPPLEGQMCLEISPLIIYPIVDRLLGGSNAEIFIPQRPLTSIEWRLVGRLTERALSQLTEAWSSLMKIQFSVAQTESNPRLVQIVPPNEVVVVAEFELKMGARAGTMSLCVPYNVIEPMMSKLVTQSWPSYQCKTATADHVTHLTQNLSGAVVELRAYLAETSITVHDLLSLQAGDTLQLGKEAAGDVMLHVEGLPKYAGTVGQYRGQRAVRLTRALSAADVAPGNNG